MADVAGRWAIPQMPTFISAARNQLQDAPIAIFIARKPMSRFSRGVHPVESEPELFGVPSANIAKRNESDSIYAAVLKLRRKGYRVIKQGRWMHMVGNRRVGHEVLKRMAEVL
jgi:hypothetical protein